MEFSDETLDFWLEVEDYKALVGSPGAARMAKRIFSTYIDDQAPREVNNQLDGDVIAASRVAGISQRGRAFLEV